MTNPLFIILNDSDEIRSQLVATVFIQSVDVSHGTWLIFAEKEININKLFKNFYIPVNCKFMVSKKHINKTNSELITEAYYLGNSPGLKLQAFGIWDSSDGLIPQKLSFFQRRKNLQGLKLRAVAATSIMFETSNSIFSYCENSSNCSGVIALFVNKSADISITPMFMGQQRLKLIDSTMPFTSASSILYFFMEMVCDADDKLKSWTRLKPKPSGFLHCVFKIFGLICESGTSSSTSIRIVQVTIQIASVLFLTAYSAQLIQSLTNGSNINIPFNSVNDFLKDKTYRLALPSHSSRVYDFSNSPIKLETQMAKKILKEMKSLPQSEVKGFQNLCNINKYALLSYRTILRRYNPPEGCIITTVATVLRDFYVMGLQKKSPLKEILNIQIEVLRNQRRQIEEILDTSGAISQLLCAPIIIMDDSNKDHSTKCNEIKRVQGEVEHVDMKVEEIHSDGY
ncbi:uncharacterized protein [Chelonus insularis]|uniref:uncharacterized protein n=1 Tax=Chelonus insularis TaxID=460826 RepID=UPI00158DFF88|nr:uncharacterized protein LOC118067896 [Chelonus insularis]